MVTGVSDLISNPTRMTAVTIFSRRAAEGEDSGALWPKIAAASAFLGWTALAGLAALSSQLIPMVLGHRWIAAGPIIAILCLQRAFTLIDGVSVPLLVAYNHARSPLGIQVAMTISGVILLFVMARHGVGAAAWSSVLIAAASMVICATIAAWNFPGLLQGIPGVLPVALGPPLATSVTAFVLAHVLRGDHFGLLANVVLEVAGGVAAFAITVFCIRGRVVDVLHSLNPPAPASRTSDDGGTAPTDHGDDDGASVSRPRNSRSAAQPIIGQSPSIAAKP
jgi:O-antigen/teichoic acid export membrane protein